MSNDPRNRRSLRSVSGQDVGAPGGETWRIFCALELPSEVREQIANHGGYLREQVPHARASWSRTENIHLTLKFLGDVPLSRVEALSNAAKRAASAAESFRLSVSGSGVFPPKGTPRVLWIGVEDQTQTVHRLYEALERECAAEGFARDARAFHPHLTVARIRRPHGARQLGEVHKESDFPAAQFEVNDLCVIRSELSPDGSRYTVIARHELSKQ